MIKRFAGVLFLLLPFMTWGQPELPQYNPNSIDPIPRYEQFYKLRVWREIDLREKQNKGFFSFNGEITRLILKSVQSGEISAIYADDSLKTTLTKEEFNTKLTMSEGEVLPAWDPAATYYLTDPVSFNGVNYESNIDYNTGINPSTAKNGEWIVTQRGKALKVEARDVYMLTLMEDVIFDRRRSRLYYDIQGIELRYFDNDAQFYRPLGWFKYKDLEKVFRNHPAEAVWFNRQNTAENRNFADAFLLRLFKGVIQMIENPDNLKIEDIYTNNQRPYIEGVWAREWAEMMLMEKEHNLWEF